MFVQDGDQYYLIENNKIVASISKEEYENIKPESKEAAAPSFNLGDRVSHREKFGNIVGITPSIYGDAIAVRFDDGLVNEYGPTQLIAAEIDRPVFSSSVQELLYDYEQYQVLAGNTLEEVEAKEREARALNLRAKSLITDSRLALSERVELDKVAAATGVDMLDYKEGKELLRLSENTDYLNRFTQFQIDPTFHNVGGFGKGDDISWLDEVEASVSSETDDSYLATLARETVSHLNREQLSDDDFMNEVREYSFDRIAKNDQDKFTLLLEGATQMRLGELESMPKEASAENYDDVDDSALFM